jgi:hypothetical protein
MQQNPSSEANTASSILISLENVKYNVEHMCDKELCY